MQDYQRIFHVLLLSTLEITIRVSGNKFNFAQSEMFKPKKCHRQKLKAFQ